MQLPDENIEYQFQRLLVPLHDSWTPVAELQGQHLLPAEEVEKIKRRATEVRGQVAAERELQNPPPALRPLQAGFIDLPQKGSKGSETLTLTAGTYTLLCKIPGHSNMKATLTVS